MSEIEERIQSLWDTLLRIRHYSFRAHADATAITQWNGAGWGEVQVRPWPQKNGLLFEEKGVYEIEGSSLCVDTQNCYGFERYEHELRLYHLRDVTPVFLLALYPSAQDQNAWVQREAHICIADCYGAALSIVDTGFDLAWTITGPKKNEHLEYAYR